MSDSFIRRFLFEHLDIRGAIVHLGDSWQQMQVDRDYQPTVAQLLGETAAITALIAGQLKQPGRLTLQLRGNGPIQLLVMDCNEQLQMRGMARSNPVVLPAPVHQLLGADQGGQLMMSLDMPNARHPYQSFVPMVGDSIAAIFEHYLEQSEQQPSRLFATAGPQAAACLFLQKMPASPTTTTPTAGSASRSWPPPSSPPNCSNSTPRLCSPASSTKTWQPTACASTTRCRWFTTARKTGPRCAT